MESLARTSDEKGLLAGDSTTTHVQIPILISTPDQTEAENGGTQQGGVTTATPPTNATNTLERTSTATTMTTSTPGGGGVGRGDHSAQLLLRPKPPRPAPPARFASDMGRRASRHAASPLARSRTQTSELSAALWRGYQDGYASSSSSDEDEDMCPASGDLSRTQTQIDREKATAADTRGKGRATRQRSLPALRGGGWRRSEKQQQQQQKRLGDGTGADDDDDGNRYRRFLVGNENYSSKGKVKKDGRLRITINETTGSGYLAKTLSAAMHVCPTRQSDSPNEAARPSPATKRLSSTSTFGAVDMSPQPRLNIVIMVIGSRGDVQPFLKIGQILKREHGHRVRVATHPTFRDAVERDAGLEFFSVGGDPAELMAFMVKNPGMIPTIETVRAGDIGRRRAAMAEMFDGFWRACIHPTDDRRDSANLSMMGSKPPFVADAIIANPPSFAHIHCAEALGIPIHAMFTFPYTPTQAFPHPLASIKKTNVDPGYVNFMSYPMVEMMIWQGLGDLINDFRVRTLGLDPVSTLWAPGATYRKHVPFTYLWSPGLVPKPFDWGDEIDISGFVFLEMAQHFKPPTDLEAFLAAGETPIYIGFGSIVVDDADRFTELIFRAVEKAGVRALVSKGWGGLGGSLKVPSNVFLLDNTPHDWLFPKVKAAVIHGGAGTTAIALKSGLPTMIVPFFGDQFFWGKMVAEARVGPSPIPYKHLTEDNLAEGIRYLLTDEARDAVSVIARNIELEGDGARNAVNSFHRNLNLRGANSMRCSIFKDQIASWQPKGTQIRLSPLAADLLADSGYYESGGWSWKKMRLLRHTEWNDFEGPGEPVTGIAGSLVSTLGNTLRGVGRVPFDLVKTSKKSKQRRLRKQQRDSLQGNGTNEKGEATAASGNDGDGLDRTDTIDRITTADIQHAYVGDVKAGVGLTAAAIVKAPVNLSVALAQGFHNAPRLYGDDTVRRPIRITGIRSGLRAARNEFIYGVYDGFTGVVSLPLRGARSDGVVGFVRGTGMGLIGLILKNLAALIGPFGYTLKGLVKQAERSRRGRNNPVQFVRRARIMQGQREARALKPDERRRLERQVVEGYQVMCELCEALCEAESKRGLVGHLDRMHFDTGLLFEDVDTARKALQAIRRGESIESLVDIVHVEDKDGRGHRKSQ